MIERRGRRDITGMFFEMSGDFPKFVLFTLSAKRVMSTKGFVAVPLAVLLTALVFRHDLSSLVSILSWRPPFYLIKGVERGIISDMFLKVYLVEI